MKAKQIYVYGHRKSRREEEHHLAIERSLGSIHRFSIPPIIYRILLLHLSDWERIRRWVWIRWDILKQVFIRFAFFFWLLEWDSRYPPWMESTNRFDSIELDSMVNPSRVESIEVSLHFASLVPPLSPLFPPRSPA